jgi:hypothetical protein
MWSNAPLMENSHQLHIMFNDLEICTRKQKSHVKKCLSKMPIKLRMHTIYTNCDH